MSLASNPLTPATTLHTDPPFPSATSPRWHGYAQGFGRDLSPVMADWLLDKGSLTQRLRCACAGPFRVAVLRQGWTRPDRDEARLLGLRLDAWAWTREVHLLCDEHPWVFARTLIPAATLRGRGRRLTQLGTRPLGHVLFADPGVRRGPVEIARLVAGQSLHRRAFANRSEPLEALWGRRSMFWIENRPLLVCEIFLPDLPVSACHRPD